MNRAERAVECFNSGFNCAQSVFSTCCEDLGLDREAGLKVSCGMGGGMGGLGGTCGAVSGACLLVGVKYGKTRQDDNQAKDKTYSLVREFFEKFEARNKTTICKELLGLDPMTADKALAAERRQQICPKLIRDASEIIGELLELEA